MEQPEPSNPPRWAQRFLRWYCRPELLEDLEGDLYEYFQRNLSKKSKRTARLIYIVDVFKFLRSYTVRKPQPASMSNLTVLGNYLKTSTRTIYRNKLFSGINIIGLAVSMSVGLLMIALLTELKSYDKFHTDYDRIYRVHNYHKRLQWDPNPYASTSILAARKVQELATGIESIAILRNGFDKDLHVGDKTLPVDGIWADPGFFKVFTWDVLGGDPTTALSGLNQVVLTENTAVKLYGTADVVGKQVLVDTANYTITAVVKDPPRNSHLRFEMLGSFTTLDTRRLAIKDKNWMKWDYMWQNYVYIKLAPGTEPSSLQPTLDKISEEGNKTLENESITLHLQPLSEVVLGQDLSNEIGPSFPTFVAWAFVGLAFVVILSACFNYTNLSIARALRRTREVGIRKVVGATRGHVMGQFLFESVLIALLSLVLSLVIFVLIRPGFISMDRHIGDIVTLEPTAKIYGYFILLAVTVGLGAGLLPAFFFSKINTAQVLKDLSSIKLFGHVGMRKALIVFQYTLSLLLIVSVGIGYRQYTFSLSYDLGLATENILNIDLGADKPDALALALSQLHGVEATSQSMFVPSTGTQWSGNIRYKDPKDSATLYYNYVDTTYLGMHAIPLIAGRNFNPSPGSKTNEAGIIINQKALRFMGIKDPQDAVGEEVFIDGERVTVIGVARDYHYSTLNNPIDNFCFRYFGSELSRNWGSVLNVKVKSDDLPGLMAQIEATWKKVDPVHPFKADFFEERIQRAYSEMVSMAKIAGFLAFLAISIASLGLLGMVVFTTETRLKEISIRKVMGASEANLVVLMSRGFLLLLTVASALAIPGAYFFFDQVMFSNITYRAPIRFIDLFAGSIAVLTLALLAIGSQTMRVARVNPATTLRNE